MPEPSRLYLFLVASAALLLMPGPAVLYIVARSVSQGRMAGLASVLGIEIANSMHVVAAAFGVSALLLSSALAFNAVKYLGAGYLVYLGMRKLLVADVPEQMDTGPNTSLRRIFSQGIVVNLLNPKVALFFFAFLPQFVQPAQGHVPVQILSLGFLFVTMAIVSDSIYALLASSIGYRLKSHAHFRSAQRYVTGSIYIGLGLTAALSGARH